MLIHCITHEGRKIAVNTAHIVTFEAFDYDTVMRSASESGGLAGIMAAGHLHKNSAAFKLCKCQIALMNSTTIIVRDTYQSIADKFSLVSEPAMPSR